MLNRRQYGIRGRNIINAHISFIDIDLRSMLDITPTFGRPWNFAPIIKFEKYLDYTKCHNRVYYNGNDARHEPTARKLKVGKSRIPTARCSY